MVLSPRSYNERAGPAVVCPVTNQGKGYPFEVTLPDEISVNGFVLADHVKSADWRVRQAEYIADAPTDILEEVRAKLVPLLGL